MGGDEVFFPCWNSSEEIVEEMKRLGRGVSVEDFLDLWGEFQKRALRMFDSVVGNERTPVVVWSSLMTEPENVAKYLSPNRFVKVESLFYACLCWIFSQVCNSNLDKNHNEPPRNPPPNGLQTHHFHQERLVSRPWFLGYNAVLHVAHGLPEHAT